MGVCAIISQIQMILVGSALYALYNLVFCLAMASSITAPHRSKVTMLGPIAKLCTMGVVAGAPLLLWGLSSDHPALYPVFDLFLAPFLADIATTVDTTLYEQSLSASSTSRSGSNIFATYASSESTTDEAERYSDGAFLATYAFILSIGLLLTAIVNFLGSHVKLANIGEYLPYPVLCGFFSTVGVTLWTLAIAIDTGKSIQHIVSSRNWEFLQYALYHHLPSALMGILMFIFGPSNKLFVIALVLTAIIGSYAVMLAFHIPLEHAQENNWFWRAKDLTVSMS
jgi:MFS superfamily sulfate permease-like transporter